MVKKYNCVTQDQIQIGQIATKTKIVSMEDVETFAQVTSDMNPAHMDDEFAKESLFGKRIAHGMLGVGLISACLGMDLPGPGTIYLGQEVKFQHPIFFDDEITAEIEVVNLTDKKKFLLAELKTTVRNQNGDILISGMATVIPPKGEE